MHALKVIQNQSKKHAVLRSSDLLVNNMQNAQLLFYYDDNSEKTQFTFQINIHLEVRPEKKVFLLRD